MTVQQFTTAGARPVDLASRAMLVTLTVRQWTARKLDKRVTKDVATQHGAQGEAGRYNKSLIAKDALAEISTIVGKARADHAFMSLPWLQDGARIMPADAFQAYSEKMREHRDAFDAAVNSFLANYDSYIHDARARLGSMFAASDYPDAATLRGRFAWSTAVLPLPDAADFRVDLGTEMNAKIRADIESTMTAALDSAMQDAWTRLHDVTRAMAERLAAYKPATDNTKASGVFRDSLVENVRELVGILPMLNISGDAKLAAAVQATADKLTKHDAATLRTDEIAREETRQAAAQIADDMAAFMGA